MKFMHCPFCSEEERLEIVHSKFAPQSALLTTSRVRCLACGACGPVKESILKNAADLAAAQSWNNRVEHAEDLALRIAFTMLSN